MRTAAKKVEYGGLALALAATIGILPVMLQNASRQYG